MTWQSIIQTKGGGLVLVLAITFGAAVLLFLGGEWFVVRFSDPKWLKKYAPLFAFVLVTAKVFMVVAKMLDRWGNNSLAGFLFVGYLIFIAACVGAWRRYLVAHPDGPPEPSSHVLNSSSADSQQSETRSE